MNYRHENQQHRQQLLNIVDRGTVEQLFTFLQGFHRRPFPNLANVLVYEGVIDDQIDFIDCTGTKYNVTPLIIAAGKGSYEKTKILLVHGANPNKQCATGDTALNLAVHRQKYSIVDLLLQYHANPNLSNQAGKTALHRAVASYNNENAGYIRVLLEAGADQTIEDRNQRIPLDEAIITNRPEIVDVLLSHDRTVVQHAYRAAIIASRHGHDQCLEILLNYGMDPNITDQTNTTPLHVAVRSLKLSTVQLLIAKGADPNLKNNRGETAISIAEFLQPDQQKNFLNILLHAPKIALSDSHSYKTDNTISNIYPLLRNHSNWSLDSDEFRSRTAPNSSVQNLLDNSNRTYWCSTQSQDAWVVFDLKHYYNINGVRIIGCENQSTPKNGHIDVSNALNGPWLKVKDFTCLFTTGNKNDFFFPELKTRFIRVYILDNYGGEDIRIQEISFFGVDIRLINLLKEYKLENSLDTLLTNGINDQETLNENQDKILNSSNKYLHINDHFQFIRLTESLKSPQLTFLEWFNPPQTTAIAGEKFRTFSVAANEDVTNRIKLEEQSENNPQAKTILMRDLEPIQGYSLVDFPDYTIQEPGRYKIRVVSVDSPHIHTSWQEIVVGPTLSYASKLNTVAEEHLYLTSTTRIFNDTTSDKENTLLSQKKSTTTTPINKDNRAFIIKVYDSESEDTEDDTYLVPVKSLEDPPYYFSSRKMSQTNDNMLINYQLEQYKPAHYTQTKTIDYYDHSTNTDDDLDDDNHSLRPFNSKTRQEMYLTPTKYRSGSRTPLTNIFPITNINNQKQLDDSETLDYGDKIIIPTKYRLQQDRIRQLLENENMNRSKQQNPYQYRQPQNLNKFNQELPSQKSHHQSRQQSHQQNGSIRELLPEQQSYSDERNRSVRDSQYQKIDHLQNPNARLRNTLSTPPPSKQQQSHYHSKQQFRQQNGSARKSPPPPPPEQTDYYEIDQSQKQTGSVQESSSQQQTQLQDQYVLVQNSLPPQRRQQSRLQNRSERGSSPQQQPDYYEIDQSQKPSNKIRESPFPQQQPLYQSRQQFDQQNRSTRESTKRPQLDSYQLEQPQKRSQSIEVLQTRQRNESEQDPLYRSPRYDVITQSHVESDEESPVQQQQQRRHHHQQLTTKNINEDSLKPLYNRYQVISGDFELRESPSNISSHSNDSKSTQMQLIFKATLQGPDVQKRAKNSIHELVGNRGRAQSTSNLDNQDHFNSPPLSINANRQNQNTTNIVSNYERDYQMRSNRNSRLTSSSHNAQSPTTRTQPDHDDLSATVTYPSFQPTTPPNESIKRPIFDDYQSHHQTPLPNPLVSSNINTHTTNDNDYDGIRQRSHSSSQNYISSKYEKNPLKQTTNSRSTSFLSSPKSKYFFGENTQNRIVDNEEQEQEEDDDEDDDDETECETFGHNSQPRSLTYPNIRRNFDYPYTTNSRFLNHGNHYSDNPQFGQQTDVGTVIGNSLTQQQDPHSSSEIQSTVGKIRDSTPLISNKQIPPQVDYEIPDAYPISTNDNRPNHNSIDSSPQRTGIQQQYPPNSNYYELNIKNNRKKKRSSNKVNRDEDDDDHQEDDDNDHDQNNDDIEDDQNNHHDINEQDHNDQDDGNYINDIDDEDETFTEDDDNHLPIPHSSAVDELIIQNPVREIPPPLPPMQYPIMNTIVGPQLDTFNIKQKSRKGFFGFFGKDKTKNVDKNNTKSSQQKSNKKKEKTSKR